MRSIETKIAHDVITGLAGAASIAISLVMFVEDFANSNLQPDRIVVDVAGVIAGAIMYSLAARQVKRDAIVYGQELRSETNSSK
ncbi:MAG TPA: hypothetical protein VMR59_03770 [Patescibacteria group bacterium]|jgi:hypothetical protein|nr:hypothetical protein [Patescibacteria group bacterium]